MARRNRIRGPAGPLVFAAVLCSAAAASPLPAMAGDSTGEIVLWHAYRGEEQKALEKTAAMAEKSLGNVKIRTLSVPFEVYTNKITNAIPRGHGPDLFIFAHELIGDWAKSGLIDPVGTCDDASLKENYLPETLAPMCREGRLYAYPVAFKSLALFYNTDMVQAPPETTDELLALARKHVSLAGSACGLVFLTGEFYPIFPFFTGFGGGIKSADGRYNLATDENARALAFIKDLVVKDKIVPEEVTG
ncbi:MAG: extracellular solute-binding protein, partial [Pseudomonadota bacterium]